MSENKNIKTVSVDELRKDFMKYAEMMRDGQEFLVLEDGEPVGRLVPQAEVEAVLHERFIKEMEEAGYNVEKLRKHHEIMTGRL
ncbi:MAG: hypothetical protein IJ576_04605 [Synergistaceae bacterium]|nr:hypothetical protein [Synergistaceae bacterium]MBR1601960.1 hypothetical protein [Synergistaceae bacterium]